MIASEQDPDASNTYQDSDYLKGMVSHFKEEERDDDNNHDRPEIDQLGREQRGVCEPSLGQYSYS